MSRLLVLRVCLVAALALACFVSVDAGTRPVSYEGHAILRIANLETAAQRAALKHITTHKHLNVTFWDDADIRVSPGARAEVEQYLHKHHLQFTVFIADLQKEIDREDQHREMHRAKHGHDVRMYTSSDDFFADYHNRSEIDAFGLALSQQYPHLVTRSQIGTSYTGLPIFVYKVTSGKKVGPEIYLEGGIHAREWIAHATVTYMLNAFVTGYGTDDKITSILDNTAIHFVLIVNPDGYDYTYTTDRDWRKTIKPNAGSNCIGTDPNRNWDNHWCIDGGSTDPCDESFCGSAPFSEPEVAAVASYVASQKNIAAAVDFHSYSQMWMTPYGYTADLPANDKDQQAMAQSAVKALTAVYGTPYIEGGIFKTIYPASGSSADWFYDNTTHVKYSFGVELRDKGDYGFVLPANQIVPSGIETLASVYAMADFLLAKQATTAHKHAHHRQTPTMPHNVRMYSRRPTDAAATDATDAAPAPKKGHSDKKKRHGQTHPKNPKKH